MWVETIEFDLLLGDVRSLKQKRSAVRPLIAELQRRFTVAVAETGDADVHRRVSVGAVAISGEARHAIEVIDAVERFVAERPEMQLLSARRRTMSTADE